MPVNVQIRNVPDEVHRRLKQKAAAAGLSLSDYMLRSAEKLAAIPTPEEARAYFRRRKPTSISSAEIVAAVRAGRGD